MRTLMQESAAAEKELTDALAKKAAAEAEYINAQKDLLEALTDAQVAEANAKAAKAKAEADIAAKEAELIIKQLDQQIEEMDEFLSPAMQKAFIAAAMAYYGAEEAYFAAKVKAEAEVDPVKKEQLEKALQVADSARTAAKKYWEDVKAEIKESYGKDFVYIDPTEAIESMFAALPDDVKSEIINKVMQAIASIVD